MIIPKPTMHGLQICVGEGENLFRLGFLYHSLRSASINGFGISERFLYIDKRSFSYTLDAEFDSYALWYY